MKIEKRLPGTTCNRSLLQPRTQGVFWIFYLFAKRCEESADPGLAGAVCDKRRDSNAVSGNRVRRSRFDRAIRLDLPSAFAKFHSHFSICYASSNVMLR